MAKNKAQVNVNHYANQEEAIRKAKGNPNKNVHHKKKNSNYGGYSTSAGSYMAQKLAERGKQQERVKLPMWLNITLIVLFAAIAVTLILRFTVYKENQLMNYISSLLLGVTCLVLFYTRRFKHTKKDSTFYTLVTVLLTVMGIVYTAMGLIGIKRVTDFSYVYVIMVLVVAGNATPEQVLAVADRLLPPSSSRPWQSLPPVTSRPFLRASASKRSASTGMWLACQASTPSRPASIHSPSRRCSASGEMPDRAGCASTGTARRPRKSAIAWDGSSISRGT